MTTILLIFAIVLGFGKSAYDKKNTDTAPKHKNAASDDLPTTR